MLPAPAINDGNDAYQVIKNICTSDHILWIEEMLLLCLSSNDTLRTWDQVAIGGIDYVNLDISTFTTRAACSACNRFILAHNHPSGSLIPSDADFELTRRVIEVLRMMGFHLLDHIIFTTNGFFSMRDMGYL